MSTFCGWWQSTQSRTSRRSPPWALSGLWHALHASVFTTSRKTVGALPFGRKSLTALAT